MASAEDLIKAVRSGSLSRVRETLAAGAPVEMDDGQGVPGLPLGIACLTGNAAIVKELLQHGAKANFPDNLHPASPLSMAARGGKTEIVRLLIEAGADVPPTLQTGLSPQEVITAQWQAYRNGKRAAPPTAATGEVQEVEEIVMPRAFGIDTTVLNADEIRAAIEMEERRKKANK